MNALTLAEAMESVEREVVREPESPRAAEGVTSLIQGLYDLLDSAEFRRMHQLTPHQRAQIAEQFQRVADTLRNMLSVAAQMEELGGQAPYHVPLVQAVRRLERSLNQRGLPLKSTTQRPTVVRHPTTKALIVLDPSLPFEQYVAAAVQRAQASELEDGGWFVELEGFPGVWADGVSREDCLATLAEVLREWLLIKLAHGDRDIPVVGEIDLTAQTRG